MVSLERVVTKVDQLLGSPDRHITLRDGAGETTDPFGQSGLAG
jgi:hypothetical protein